VPNGTERCGLGAASRLGYAVVVARAVVRPESDRSDPRPEEYFVVAATCDVCGKGPGFGHNISHSHRRTKRRWNPNIQRVRTLVGATPKRLNVCTSCLKAGKVVRSA
jgi:large subunit ribosomal protein L28